LPYKTPKTPFYSVRLGRLVWTSVATEVSGSGTVRVIDPAKTPFYSVRLGRLVWTSVATEVSGSGTVRVIDPGFQGTVTSVFPEKQFQDASESWEVGAPFQT